MREEFLTKGCVKFGQDPRLLGWLDTATEVATAAETDPRFSQWHRHQGTWFAGVNALENNAKGGFGTDDGLGCDALDFTREMYGWLDLDPAQVSVVYPGYPKKDTQESDTAHNFRKRRDAAHVDGLKPVGPKRRRKLDEFHAYVLGLPLGDCDQSPLVVWEGSHTYFRTAFKDAVTGLRPEEWSEVDVTDIYQTTRRRVFEECERIELPVRRGEATVLHRLALHGVAPWRDDDGASKKRSVLYFRPELPGGAEDWLTLP